MGKYTDRKRGRVERGRVERERWKRDFDEGFEIGKRLREKLAALPTDCLVVVAMLAAAEIGSRSRG